MVAVDTNVVVRYLVADDERQAEQARRLIDHHPILLTTTVVLETEWVLRGVYGHARQDVIEALRGMAALPTVTCDDPEALALALRWAERGLDFADALHAATGRRAEALATFDGRLARRARAAGGPRIRLL